MHWMWILFFVTFYVCINVSVCGYQKLFLKISKNLYFPSQVYLEITCEADLVVKLPIVIMPELLEESHSTSSRCEAFGNPNQPAWMSQSMDPPPSYEEYAMFPLFHLRDLRTPFWMPPSNRNIIILYDTPEAVNLLDTCCCLYHLQYNLKDSLQLK